MNIKEAKQELLQTIQVYTRKDSNGHYLLPSVRQRPILLIGPPGIGKTAIMEQAARECGIGLVAYTITHHTRQSAVGLPVIVKKNFQGKEYSVTEYTMSEIIASVYEKNHLGLTCMLAPKLDYSSTTKPDGSMLNYYVKLINEQKGETGLSGTCESETDVIQKLQEDQEFMQKKLNTFAFSSFYAGEQTDEEMEKALQQPVLEQIRTVVKAKDTEGDIVRYQNDQVTSQKVISEEEEQFTYRSWMKVKSVESALGYTSVLLDLDAILYPKTEEDRWENIGKEFAANLSTYWKLLSGSDGTTVSECDTRIRTFLNSRYEDDREDNAITLRTTGTDETAYYVLRTHNEDVRKVTGGTAEKLEDSAWLIRAEQSEVRITLGASDQRYYYEKGAKNE